jgi:predicted DCC family thiol-disulfide oxidoreductase YuxK
VVAWVRRHDKQSRFHAVPYQDAPSPPMTPALRAACEKAVHVLTTDGRTLRAGRASLFVLANIGYGWLARPLLLPPFVWLVELGYRIVAAHRPFFARFLFRE